MDKKANFALAGLFIAAAIIVILFGNLLAPQVKSYITTPEAIDCYNRTNSSVNQTYTVTHIPVDSYEVRNGAVTLPTANYTVNEDTGVFTFRESTVPAAYYCIYYEYIPANYIDSPGEQALFGIIILAAIIGIIYFILSGFNLL